MLFCCLLIFYLIQHFQNYLSGITSECQSVWIQSARHVVGPDLGPNCLQTMSADDTRRQKVNVGAHMDESSKLNFKNQNF